MLEQYKANVGYMLNGKQTLPRFANQLIVKISLAKMQGRNLKLDGKDHPAVSAQRSKTIFQF